MARPAWKCSAVQTWSTRHPAFATHRVCCNGVFWSLSWYEERANMSYTIDLSRTQA